jgi:CubicO group peptidase (beta-lactamase class C family)
MRAAASVAGSFVVAIAAALSSAPALPADAIDDYLAREMAARKIPGLGLAIARDGAVVRASSYGLAHVETASPVSAESIFAIASLDKQITAAGLLKAAELGKLGLDDPVSKWVDVELPGATLRQLVSHLSGLPDEVAGSIEGRSYTDYSSAQLLATVAGLVPLAPPGARFSYSDAGLFLAQLATEKAAGEPWWDFLRRELFAPAGMATPVSMTPARLVPHRVSAYTLDAAGDLVRDRQLDVDYGPLYSDLGMTVADFARFLAAQDGSKMLSAASVATLTTPVATSDGAFAGELFQWSRYGLGVGLDDLLGEPVTLHSGHSGVGFVRLPKRKLSIVVFTNLEHPAGSDPVGLAIGVAGLLEPVLSLAGRPALAKADPALVARLRADYEALLSGRPDLARYAPSLRLAAFEGAPGLAGRKPRLGEIAAFELLAEAPLDGERTLLCRARHERGTIYFRLSFDARGEIITRAVWWHV